MVDSNNKITMPRIEPIQLLNCLSVLLAPNGGIRSRDELQRTARLMKIYSKKLVSKCIYIQILKCTETELLGLFMASGGWTLVHTWLTESIVTKNWPLVRELLELLLLCPVDIERLKTNNCPKLVKELSKEENHFAIRALASKLVEQWLKTVKGETVIPINAEDIPKIIAAANDEDQLDAKVEIKTESDCTDQQIRVVNNKDSSDTKHEETFDTKGNLNNDEDGKIKQEVKEDNDKDSEAIPVLKITVKDGKQVLSQIEESKVKSSEESLEPKDKAKIKDKSKEKNSSSSKSSSSKHSTKSHSSSSDKHKSKSSSSRHNSSSSSNSSKNKDKHSSKESSKDKHSQSSKTKHSSSSSKKTDKSSKPKDDSAKTDKDKSKDKKSESLENFSALSENKEKQVPSINKLGKIPKLSDVKRDKPSISIEVRKPDEPKPKTVKTFNSKFRKHGLEEEVKPPPSRATLLNKKPPPVLPPTIPLPKRPSPVHNDPPPEKKIKTIDIVEKPGAIKLIPPKPKPMMLLESDMFMDALNASATNKKEPKKRKRRTSGSKDTSNDGSPPPTPTLTSSPNSENKSVPPRFYQDTLDTEESKEKGDEKISDDNNEMSNHSEDKTESIDIAEPPHTLTVNGLKGVLCYHKRKGPKRSIKWKPDSELEEIQYFELDETERVNVTKNFTDMKHLERIHEREAFQKARNLCNDDVMEEKTFWRPLILIDAEGQIEVEYGKNSKERDIQALRQKGTLQPLYFHKSMIPDSPLEPDTETHTYVEPTIIPLEDITGNQDNISDFRNMPWPEPKGNAPPTTTPANLPSIFPGNINQFPNNFPPSQFPGGIPGFQGPPMGPGDWSNGIPPNMMPNGLPGPIPPAGMPPVAMPPGLMVAPDNMMMAPEMFGPNAMFPGPPEGFNMQQSMFPMDFNMPGPPMPPGPEGFNGGPQNFRGPMRGRGVGGHWRGKNMGNWEGPARGRGGHARGGRKTVCIYFQRKGSCRQGDKCTFLHPGVNCPF